MSEQERVDRQMCKPGYTWNETLGRCLGAAELQKLTAPRQTAQPLPSPDDAIQQEIASRETTGEVL
jgi:hypothetical protein